MAKADRAEAAAKLRALAFHKGRAAAPSERGDGGFDATAEDTAHSRTEDARETPPERGAPEDGATAARANAPGANAARATAEPHPASQHPATPVRRDRTPRRDIVDVDPTRILEAGPYIREWDEEGEEFERLCATVRERGQIDTPIWIRSRGGAGNREMVLVAGKGRLRAALAVGLPTVPVRDYGELDDGQAIALQVQENLNRQDMTPGETAQALWLLSQHGTTVTEIARTIGRDKGYVSVMARTGEALQTLSAAERATLSRRGMLQVRECQAVAAAGAVQARSSELRRILALGGASVREGRRVGRRAGTQAGGDPSLVEAAATRRAAAADTSFAAREVRNGRSFRMRWDRSQLARDPGTFAATAVDAVRQEMAALAAALYELEVEARAAAASDSDPERSDAASRLAAARSVIDAYTRQGTSR